MTLIKDTDNKLALHAKAVRKALYAGATISVGCILLSILTHDTAIFIATNIGTALGIIIPIITMHRVKKTLPNRNFYQAWMLTITFIIVTLWMLSLLWNNHRDMATTLSLANVVVFLLKYRNDGK